MFLKKITFPCSSYEDKSFALEKVAEGKGQIQTYRIDYSKQEIHISIIVEPANEENFINFIDSLGVSAKLSSGSRGGRGPITYR